MKELVKEMVMGLLVSCCIIWMIAFNPSQFGPWFKIAACLGGVTWFWWWICDFGNPFKLDKENDKN